MNKCPCGEAVPDARWRKGYHYCFKKECFRKYGKKQVIVAEHVNKSIPAIYKVVTKDTKITREDFID